MEAIAKKTKIYYDIACYQVLLKICLIMCIIYKYGEVPERLKGAPC